MAGRLPGAKPGSTFAIYYGWLTEDDAGAPNDDAQRIAAAEPPLLIANLWTAAPERHRNLSHAVLGMLRGAGTQVFGYVATGCGSRRRSEVEAEVDECIAAGLDGIFFDEADPLRDDTQLGYYSALAARIRRGGKRIIVNPGVAQCGERIMEVTDILMVEHRWRDLKSGSLWSYGYPRERFMGVSSNEENAMGYAVDAERAVADTQEAWRRGVGWHTSTELYTKLPDWFETYLESAR